MVPATTSLSESKNIGIHPPGYRLPASAHVGSVRLAVSNLERSVAFYTQIVGLAVLKREGHTAELGVGGEKNALLELDEIAGVEPIGRRSVLGLYHTAFVLPSREALSSFVGHLRKIGTPFGAGDHTVSEAIYLTDPDGLGVEVYADRDRSQWVIEGSEIMTGTKAVQFSTLPAVASDSWTGAPAGTGTGHVHFYVNDLAEASRFYHAALGMDLVTWRFPGALFVSAGGYHHHVGLNVWAAGSPVASKENARLLYWELVLPTEEEVERVASGLRGAGYLRTTTAKGAPSFSDEWGITVALRAETASGT